MEDDIKIRWIEALRSGKYEQTTGILRATNDSVNYSYCVVGVLADVIDPNAWTANSEFPNLPLVYWNGDNVTIPKTMMDEHGIDPRIVDQAMGRNDMGETFEQLADYLEEELSECSVG